MRKTDESENLLPDELKQKAYDDALAAGDAAATVSAAHALKLSKAKANEAAVASKRQLPFPGLLN